MAIERINVKPNTVEWLEERRKSLGASDLSAILGLSKWSNAYDIKLSKIAVADQFPSDAQIRGHFLEPIMIMAYGLQYETVPEEGHMLRNSDYPYLHASLDGVAATDKGNAVLEIKTTSKFCLLGDDEEFDGLHWGPTDTDMIPEYVQVQVQQQMLVSDMDRAIVYALFAGQDVYKVLVSMIMAGVDKMKLAEVVLDMEPRTYYIERDQELCEMIAKESAEWWQKYIIEDEEVPNLPYAKDNGNIKAADEKAAKELATAHKPWLALERAKARLEAKKEKLQHIIGEASGLSAGDEKVTWKKSKGRTKIDWEKVAYDIAGQVDMEKENIDAAIKEYTTTSEGPRIFRWPSSWKK